MPGNDEKSQAYLLRKQNKTLKSYSCNCWEAICPQSFTCSVLLLSSWLGINFSLSLFQPLSSIHFTTIFVPVCFNIVIAWYHCCIHAFVTYWPHILLLHASIVMFLEVCFSIETDKAVYSYIMNLTGCVNIPNGVINTLNNLIYAVIRSKTNTYTTWEPWKISTCLWSRKLLYQGKRHTIVKIKKISTISTRRGQKRGHAS